MKIIELTNEFSMGNGISEVIKNISDGLTDNFPVEIWYNYFLRKLPKTKAKLIQKKYLQMLIELFRLREKTIIHTHFGRTFFIGSLAKILNPNIIHLHTEYINTPIEASQGKKSSYYSIEFLHKLSYLYGRGITKAIGISKYASDEIKRYGVKNNKIDLIYLGVESKIEKSPKVNSPPIFGSLARFSKSKNMKFLLDNYKKFPMKSQLYIAGAIDILDKDYYLQCDRLAKREKVKLISNLPREKFNEFYNQFDIFLYPSQWEGFGLPIMEAMSYGKPVVCFKKYAMPELVKNNYNGFVVEDGEEFIEKVNYLFAHPQLVKKMSKNALNESKKFSKEKMVNAYLKTIKELINHDFKK